MLPWNRILHELNLTPLIQKINSKQDKLTAGENIIIDENNVISSTGGGGGTTNYNLLNNKPSINGVELEGNKTTAQLGLNYNDLTNKPSIPTVNNATLTIKQGGTTKGTFTANAFENVEIDLDAGGGGGTEYTAGNGIDITNNVISVENPLKVLAGTLLNIPVLYDNGGGTLYNMDGTLATLASFADLGATAYNFLETIIMQLNFLLSGTYYNYDWNTQTHTQESFSDVRYASSDPNIISTNNALFDVAYAKFISLQLSATTFLNGTFIIGSKNGHAYFGFYSTGEPTNFNYVEFSSADGTVKLIGV